VFGIPRVPNPEYPFTAPSGRKLMSCFSPSMRNWPRLKSKVRIGIWYSRDRESLCVTLYHFSRPGYRLNRCRNYRLIRRTENCRLIRLIRRLITDIPNFRTVATAHGQIWWLTGWCGARYVRGGGLVAPWLVRCR
jgi:hypothetical protein